MNMFVQHLLEEQVFAVSNYSLKVCTEKFKSQYKTGYSTTCKTEFNTQVKLFILI